jgi:protein-tyrosine phosphatase
LNLHWVTDDIAIARQPADSDWPSICEQGIRCVVDLREEASDNGNVVGPHELCYLRAPIREGEAMSTEGLQLTTAWIEEHLGEHGPVLVHCREGRGRSPMVVIASLVRLGLPLHEAYKITMRGQPALALNSEQQAALVQFAQLRG